MYVTGRNREDDARGVRLGDVDDMSSIRGLCIKKIFYRILL